MRVFLGVKDQAGQPAAIAHGLRGIGVDADAWTTGRSRFGYTPDRLLPIGGFRDPAQVLRFLEGEGGAYDVYHFHCHGFLTAAGEVGFPNAVDLLLLKLMGKVVVMHYRGSEVRLRATFAAANPFSYADDDGGRGLFDAHPDAVKIAQRDFALSICDAVLATDPEVESYVPGSIIVPRVVDLDRWQYVGPGSGNPPIVVHAPSKRATKGTGEILQAVERLRGKGKQFEFRLIENVSNDEAKALMSDADIVIDQIRIGWYGVFAVEAMALGKPVVAYLRDDLRSRVEPPPPVIRADPDSIERVLEGLLDDDGGRRQLALAGRKFVETVHDCKKVALDLKALYERLLERDAAPGIAGVYAYLERQHVDTANRARQSALSARVDEYRRLIASRGAGAGMARLRSAIYRRLGGLFRS